MVIGIFLAMPVLMLLMDVTYECTCVHTKLIILHDGATRALRRTLSCVLEVLIIVEKAAYKRSCFLCCSWQQMDWGRMGFVIANKECREWEQTEFLVLQ